MRSLTLNNSFVLWFIYLLGAIFLCQNSFSFQTFIPGIGKRQITVITFDTISQNTMYIGTGSDFSTGETGAIFKSTNGGTTWDTLLQNVTVRDIDIHPTNPNIIYATLGINFLTLAGIVKSYDGGLTWVKSDSGIYSDYEVGPSQLAIDPVHPETLYTGTAGVWPGKFYKSTDGGKFWYSTGDSTHINAAGVTAIGIHPDSTNIVYVGTSAVGYIMKSTNYGKTWNYTGLHDGVTRTIKFGSSATTVYVGSATERRLGFFKSTNAGSNWANIDEGIIDSVFDVHSIEFDGSGFNRRVFITGNTHEYKPRIYYRYESDTKWKLLLIDSTIAQFYTMAVHRGKIWLGSWGGLYVLDVPTKVIQEKPLTIPEDIRLYQNYPNPFNGTTKISFELSKFLGVVLEIVDISGKSVNKLYNGALDAGKYEIAWDGKNNMGQSVSSGMYFVILRSQYHQQMQKVVLVK